MRAVATLYCDSLLSFLSFHFCPFRFCLSVSALPLSVLELSESSTDFFCPCICLSDAK
ncbi:hypothetical protein GCWU000341_00310 [Oribacterium sp. oral taxon 078 str. F0262]|nr:hypothetical protein GCWU000341_00310 [Oribacterium sp. oral taxon 078 str. F0262]